MNDFMADSESKAYGHTHMKARLKEHFGDQILITEINGKSNVVTFRSNAETILQEFHVRQNDNPEEEKKHIIKAAAQLIKNDIKLVEPSTENYPPVTEMGPLHDPVTWYKIIYTGEQVAQWDFQNKGRSR